MWRLVCNWTKETLYVGMAYTKSVSWSVNYGLSCIWQSIDTNIVDINIILMDTGRSFLSFQSPISRTSLHTCTVYTHQLTKRLTIFSVNELQLICQCYVLQVCSMFSILQLLKRLESLGLKPHSCMPIFQCVTICNTNMWVYVLDEIKLIARTAEGC